jgi:formylmethanofuran dehydrogenase subunit B
VNIKLDEAINQRVIAAFMDILYGTGPCGVQKMTGLSYERAEEIVRVYEEVRYGMHKKSGA